MCDYDVIIVGGGIAGLATAASLVRRGMDKSRIAVYEKAFALEPTGAAIGLFPNGFAALDEISSAVASRVRESSIQHDKSRMYELDGTTMVREVDYSKISMVSPTYLVWYLLQHYLRDDLEQTEPTEETSTSTASQETIPDSKEDPVLRLGHMVTALSVDDTTSVVTVTIEKRQRHSNDENGASAANGNSVMTKTCRVLVGADGIHSRVRSLLFDDGIPSPDNGTTTTTTSLLSPRLNYHNKLMFRGVLPLEKLDDGICPPTGISIAYQGEEKGKLFAFRETAKDIVTFTSMAVFPEEEAIHISGKGGGRPGAEDKQISNDEKKDYLHNVFSTFPPAVHHVLDRTLTSSIFINAVYDIDVMEEWSQGPVVLIGDAAHAMTPGMGQGANQGLEDACELGYTLSRLLGSSTSEQVVGTAIADTLSAFWRGRIDRVKSIHALSRARTQQVNQSTKTTRIYEKKVSNDFLTNELYQWKPSFTIRSEEPESVVS